MNFRKSSFSGHMNSNCVEVAFSNSKHAPPTATMRNSRFPDGPELVFTEAEWNAFIAGVKEGEFDDLIA
jgi:Domain of unknown function (DUF397)